MIKSANFPNQQGSLNSHLSLAKDEENRMQAFYHSIFNEDGSTIGDTRPFNFGRFQTFYSCLEEINKSIQFSFDNLEKGQNCRFSYQSLKMIKSVLPSDFKKIRRLVFDKYLPALLPHYQSSMPLTSCKHKAYYWREIVTIKLLVDYLIAYNLLLAPTVDSGSCKLVKEVLPLIQDLIRAMPDQMVAALNEE